MSIIVLSQRNWLAHWGGCNNPHGGLEGKVTKLLTEDGCIFYVRENIRGDRFERSANARIGLKRGETSGYAQVLDLACPEDRREEITELVKMLDTKKREVRRHRQFTTAWAEKLFNKPMKENGR